MKRLAWLLIPLLVSCGMSVITPMVKTTTPSGTVTETPQKVAMQQSISANQAACYERLDANQAQNSLAIPEDMTGTEYALVAMANAFQTLAESLRPATDPCAVSNMADVEIAKQRKWEVLGDSLMDNTFGFASAIVPWHYGASVLKSAFAVAGDVTTIGSIDQTTTFEEGTIGGSSGPAGDGGPGGGGEVADTGGGAGGEGGPAAEAGAGTTGGGSTGGNSLNIGRGNANGLAGNDNTSSTGTKSGNAFIDDRDGVNESEVDAAISLTVPVGGQ